MSALFLDASVIVAAFDRDDSNHDAARAAITADATFLATLDLARYEVANAAIHLWQSPASLAPLLAAVDRIAAADGGLVASDNTLLRDAAEIAAGHRISIYDASYVAAAAMTGRRLVSCDVRDLVSKGLAVLPEAVGQ